MWSRLIDKTRRHNECFPLFLSQAFKAKKRTRKNYQKLLNNHNGNWKGFFSEEPTSWRLSTCLEQMPTCKTLSIQEREGEKQKRKICKSFFIIVILQSIYSFSPTWLSLVGNKSALYWCLNHCVSFTLKLIFDLYIKKILFRERRHDEKSNFIDSACWNHHGFMSTSQLLR